MPVILSNGFTGRVQNVRAPQSSGSSLTLADVSTPGHRALYREVGTGVNKRRIFDASPDIRSAEPSVMDAFQRAEYSRLKDIKQLNRFAASRPSINMRPRLIRPTVPAVKTIEDTPVTVAVNGKNWTGEMAIPASHGHAIEPAKAPRGKASIYNRHGLTSRGKRLHADIGVVLRAELAQVTTAPAIRSYPALKR